MEKDNELTEFSTDEKKKLVDIVADEKAEYGDKLAAYEYLLDNGAEVVDYMISKMPSLLNTESGQMLVEILAEYKGRKDVYLWLVTYFYRGEDIPLFARLLGAYGNEDAIEILTSYANDYDVDYNEFMEIRNAVEQLGGEFNVRKDFSDDPLFGYLKGVVETDIFNRPNDDESGDDESGDEDESDGGCSCGCHHSHTETHEHSHTCSCCNHHHDEE